MAQLMVAIIAFGACGGAIGGILGYESWFHGGATVMAIGCGGLIVYSIVKNPFGMIRGQAEIDSQIEGAPPPQSVQPPIATGPTTSLVVDTAPKPPSLPAASELRGSSGTVGGARTVGRER